MLAGVKPVSTPPTSRSSTSRPPSRRRRRQGVEGLQLPGSAHRFDSLEGNGVDVIGMANNHALDYGQSGLAQTLAAAKVKGTNLIGVGDNEKEAYKPSSPT